MIDGSRPFFPYEHDRSPEQSMPRGRDAYTLLAFFSCMLQLTLSLSSHRGCRRPGRLDEGAAVSTIFLSRVQPRRSVPFRWVACITQTKFHLSKPECRGAAAIRSLSGHCLRLSLHDIHSSMLLVCSFTRANNTAPHTRGRKSSKPKHFCRLSQSV